MIESFQGQYRFLSNFYPAAVELDGLLYRSVEHAYQAAKTNDKAERDRIRSCEKPWQAKRLGRTVTLRGDWEEIKLDVMFRLLRDKFSQSHLRDLLMATGDARLIEGNDWGDTFWGVAWGRGHNHLGKLLMQVRDELRRMNTKEPK